MPNLTDRQWALVEVINQVNNDPLPCLLERMRRTRLPSYTRQQFWHDWEWLRNRGLVDTYGWSCDLTPDGQRALAKRRSELQDRLGLLF